MIGFLARGCAVLLLTACAVVVVVAFAAFHPVVGVVLAGVMFPAVAFLYALVRVDWGDA